MTNKQEILDFLCVHREFMCDKFSLTKIGLFGSFAREEDIEESDIDILVEFKPNTPHLYELKNQLRDFIGTHFHRNIDIVREKYLKARVKSHILQEAVYVE